MKTQSGKHGKPSTYSNYAGKNLITREIGIGVIQYETAMKSKNIEVRVITGWMNINSG